MATQGDPPIVRVERDIAATFDGLSALHEMVKEYWLTIADAGGPRVSGTCRALFESALAEIAGNIVRYAYPEPRGEETFHITLQCFGDRMEAVLLDQGVPYNLLLPSGPPDMRAALDDLDLDHGWGLPIARAASDALDYARLDGGYNRWRLDKRLP